MVRFILLIAGTALTLFFLIMLLAGRKYDKYVQNLDGMEFPLKDLFIVGFVWASFPILKLKNKRKEKLVYSAGLLYEQQYASYYANIAWVQMITYVHLGLALTFLLAALIYQSHNYVLFVGIFITVFMAVYALTSMSNKVTERRENCEAELANAVSTMAILLNSGMVLRDAWALVSKGEGPLYELMRQSRADMRNGASEVEAIHRFGKRCDSPEIKKFASNMIQSIENGGRELIRFMEQQSDELWEEKKQLLLRQGELAATKLLVPIVLIFVGILIIIMAAAFAGALF